MNFYTNSLAHVRSRASRCIVELTMLSYDKSSLLFVRYERCHEFHTSHSQVFISNSAYSTPWKCQMTFSSQNMTWWNVSSNKAMFWALRRYLGYFEFQFRSLNELMMMTLGMCLSSCVANADAAYFSTIIQTFYIQFISKSNLCRSSFMIWETFHKYLHIAALYKLSKLFSDSFFEFSNQHIYIANIWAECKWILKADLWHVRNRIRLWGECFRFLGGGNEISLPQKPFLPFVYNSRQQQQHLPSMSAVTKFSNSRSQFLMLCCVYFLLQM